MTVKEPAPLVLSNVAWHLSLGASSVHVYLDDPDDPVAEALDRVHGCHLVRCTPEHWAAVGGFPGRDIQTRRQSLNATQVYRTTDADWLIHLDADEFLMPMRPMNGLLADYAGVDGYLRFFPWERTYLKRAAPKTLFEGGFRVPYFGPPEDDTALFGAAAPFLVKGMTAHAAGKSMIATGQALNVGIHAPKSPDGRLRGTPVPEVALMHFDGLTPLHWQLKVLRYAMQPPSVIGSMMGEHRSMQVRKGLNRAKTEGGLAKFHRRLKYTGPELREKLDARGMFTDAPFNPAEAIRQVLGYLPDLSVTGFDAELKRRFPAEFALLK